MEMLEIQEENVETGRKFDDYYWAALKVTPSGDVVVKKTRTLRYPDMDDFKKGLFRNTDYDAYLAAGRKYAKERDEARRQLLASLVADGWEPVGVNEDGQVVTMKR